MNALTFLYRFFTLLFATMLLFGCIGEQTDNCVQYELTVNAVTPSGQDVTSSGTITSIDLYLFDENGFVRMVPKGTSSDYLFGTDRNKSLTLVAWANLKGDSLKVPSLAVGTSLENAQIGLLETESGYNLPVTDLFYARRRLTSENLSTRGMQSDTVKLVMERISAGLSVKVSHLQKYFEGEEEKLHIVVRGVGTALNFLGNPLGKEAGYIPTMHATQGKDEWMAPLFRVFPTQEDYKVFVDLYRNDKLLFTINTDDEGNPLKAVPGMETYITVDFDYARLLVNVSVLPWGSGGGQYTEF